MSHAWMAPPTAWREIGFQTDGHTGGYTGGHGRTYLTSLLWNTPQRTSVSSSHSSLSGSYTQCYYEAKIPTQRRRKRTDEHQLLSFGHALHHERALVHEGGNIWEAGGGKLG